MLRAQIKTPENALIYLADCSAATCDEFASRKSTSYFALERHKNITLIAIYYAEQFGQEQSEIVTVKKRLNEALEAYNSAHKGQKQFELVKLDSPVILTD